MGPGQGQGMAGQDRAGPATWLWWGAGATSVGGSHANPSSLVRLDVVRVVSSLFSPLLRHTITTTAIYS